MPTLRLMSFNVLGCRGFPAEDGGPVVFPLVSAGIIAAVAERIRAADADVVVLQEAPPEADVRVLARLAGMEAAFFPAQGSGGEQFPFGFPGAVLARHPLAAACDRATALRGAGDARFQRFWGSVAVDVGGGRPLLVQGTHLCADWGGVWREDVRLAEVDALLAAPAGDLIAADCNTRPEEAPWRRLRDAGWRDAWIEAAAAGPGLTSDARRRVQRIDQVWLAPSSPWRARAARVADEGFRVVVDGQAALISDHFPLLVDLARDPA